MGLYVWENMPQKDLFIVSNFSEERGVCEFSDINVSAYLNKLHDFLHATSSKEAIVDFIAEDPCVRDGSVNVSDNSMLVKVVWMSNGEILEFAH